MLKTSPIKCCSPTILRNPHLRELILEHGAYYMNGETFLLTPSLRATYTHSFPYNLFNPFVNGVTLDDLSSLDNYYIYNPETSETYPMYILVPCGKCDLCKQRKSREWEFRAICESQHSSNAPYFITLTYDNQHLPESGVNKPDVQLFLKRLRRSLDRLNLTHNLRYFACAEYGSKYGRPHYHMILWNMPKMDTLKHEIAIIEKSWSNGFILCKPCTYGAISYCMKYMRKDQLIPHGKTPGFFLSSRRGGGLGIGVANDFADFYRSNPYTLDMTIVDRYSGDTFKSTIPSYFVRKWFPTMSLLVPKDIRDTFSNLIYRLDLRTYLIDHDSYSVDTSDSIQESLILSKYCFLPRWRSTIPPSWLTKTLDILGNCRSSLYLENEQIISEHLSVLDDFFVDANFIEYIFSVASKRKESITTTYLNAPDYDIESLLYELNKQKNLSQKREIL